MEVGLGPNEGCSAKVKKNHMYRYCSHASVCYDCDTVHYIGTTRVEK
jgi:hypothetical protein